MHLELTIPGKPVPKGRPRFSRRTGEAHTPDKTKAYEKHVKLHAWAAVHMTPPDEQKGWPVKKKQLYCDLWIYIAPEQRCDSDNIVKSILDGCEGVLYRNDSQVLPRVQRYERNSSNPRVELRVEVI